LYLHRRRDQAEGPRAQSAVERHDMSAGAGVVVLGTDAAGEDVLRDVDLMFFAINVSQGTHAVTRCILGALAGVAVPARRRPG
jgi:hypothetical protein